MWQPGANNAGKSAGKGGNGGEGRAYVSVMADYLPDGTVKPVGIWFDCGPMYVVTGVKSAIHMSSTKQNGAETRYCVRIGDHEHYLYFEDVSRSRKSRWSICDSERSLL